MSKNKTTHQNCAVDFSHRLASEDPDLSDDIILISNRAIAVLSILSMQFHQAENIPVYQSESITAHALDSVICDLKDIQSMMSNFYNL